jgi:glycogen debranching enzyme
MHLVHEVGPHAPDSSYARVAFDAVLPFGSEHDGPTVAKAGRDAGLTVEWSRIDRAGAVGGLSVSFAGTLTMHGYFPWDWEGVWHANYGASDERAGQERPVGHRERQIACHEISGLTADGECAIALVLQQVTGGNRRDHDGGPDVTAIEAVVPFSVSPGDRIIFTACMADRLEVARDAARRLLVGDTVSRRLQQAAAAYESSRVAVQGHWEGLASSITNNLHWMVSIKPETGRRYAPAGRRWIFPRHGGGRDHWTVFCWDSFLNALQLAVESPELARDALLAVLETQYDNGNIPNWRGRYSGTPDRSQPPIGSFAVLKCYLRTGDISLLDRAFPHLERWSAWWRASKNGRKRRDGNDNGLFEWGCDLGLLTDSPAAWENQASHHQLAAWESGQDDLPNWDDAVWMEQSETFNLESVDLNSLLALDCECLALMAERLGLSQKAVLYRDMRCRLSDRVNEQLWDDALGMYVDRFWDGRRSNRLAASHFYPLLAGIPTAERAERMLVTLLDETMFWGRYVLPTISRDDPAFSDQQYWRGTIWPPPNYLAYQGLRRYRFDDVAGELAGRSVDLFLRSWRDYQTCRENYDSRTGEGGGQAYQSWGPLFALTGIEEFIDSTPWDGLRVGTLTPPLSSKIKNVVLNGRRWDILLSPEGYRVDVDGKGLLYSTGPLVLRHLEVAVGQISAETLSTEPISLAVNLHASQLHLTIDGRERDVPAQDVRLPAGTHRIRLTQKT